MYSAYKIPLFVWLNNKDVISVSKYDPWKRENSRKDQCSAEDGGNKEIHMGQRKDVR